MEKCFYFAENQKTGCEPGTMTPGFGFTPNGLWRSRLLPSADAGLLLDDRFLPSRAGIDTACRALAGWTGLIVLDFERAPAAPLTALARSLSEKRLILPPAYAGLPHEAVLIGPWLAECSFSLWLSRRQERYGRVMLDALPLRLQCFPGGCRRRWNRDLPERGYPCPALGCLHRQLPDGSILFWDSKSSLSARLEAAGVPAVLFSLDWDPLPSTGP